jgi:inositol polyphosphate 1-phosphatase
VEEKTGEDKNAKFDQDFKTLADVLIQETVRHDVGAAFPQLASSIMGEESNKFTNQLGESITVEIQDTEEATKALLMKVLDNNDLAAGLLSAQVYLVNIIHIYSGLPLGARHGVRRRERNIRV